MAGAAANVQHQLAMEDGLVRISDSAAIRWTMAEDTKMANPLLQDMEVHTWPVMDPTVQSRTAVMGTTDHAMG